ncbi:global nitrogen regulator [mine drainage metagenome]|uniref:Global nitrogen regulator n=1 Tax=mine drainage metagenome TaxID=410659 RepID=A0A1J5RTY6_9ZZZZ
MLSVWRALLVAHPDLAPIPGTLREAAEVKAFARGETLFRQGERPRAMLFVLTGEIRLVRLSRAGSEIILQRSRGGFIAEASLESKTYHCDAIAAAEGQLLRFPLRAFRQAIGTEPGFRDAWIAHLAGEVRKLRAQSERLSLHGAAERIVHYLESEGKDGVLTLSQSRKAWAAELALSHEVLYRTLGRLQAEGVISVAGERITLHRP